MGVEPTNKEPSWTGITIDRIAQGRIVESWTNWDMMGMMLQLGAIPDPGRLKDVRALVPLCRPEGRDHQLRLFFLPLFTQLQS
jgi:hypothetical protein